MNLISNPAEFSPDRALSLLESLLAQSQAEATSITLKTGTSALTRFSDNQITQNLNRNEVKVTITSHFGDRSASASTTDINPESLQETIHRSEELAQFAPADPEWVPLLEPQIYDDKKAAFDEQTATISPMDRAKIVAQVCQKCLAEKAQGSGNLSTEAGIYAIANSQGLRAYSQTTQADFSLTARLENGSGWDEHTTFTLNQIPFQETTATVINRAAKSRHPLDITPGTYPVIFSSAAASEFIKWLGWSLDARWADEGRSFMSKTTGETISNRLGEQLFSPLITIERNPFDTHLQISPFFSDGFPNLPLTIIKNGIPQTLAYSRYWAQKQNQQPTGLFYPLIMTGSEQTLENLIAHTEQGILVHRVWYLNATNPRTLEVTGMTRDGTFWIEGGKIAYPIKNLRFIQAIPEMLQNVEAIGEVRRYGFTIVPSLKVKAFNFSSVTDSV